LGEKKMEKKLKLKGISFEKRKEFFYEEMKKEIY
jgi:hypothetical protein